MWKNITQVYRGTVSRADRSIATIHQPSQPVTQGKNMTTCIIKVKFQDRLTNEYSIWEQELRLDLTASVDDQVNDYFAKEWPGQIITTYLLSDAMIA
jgi:hypothetical protein